MSWSDDGTSAPTGPAVGHVARAIGPGDVEPGDVSRSDLGGGRIARAAWVAPIGGPTDCRAPRAVPTRLAGRHQQEPGEPGARDAMRGHEVNLRLAGRDGHPLRDGLGLIALRMRARAPGRCRA